MCKKEGLIIEDGGLLYLDKEITSSDCHFKVNIIII